MTTRARRMPAQTPYDRLRDQQRDGDAVVLPDVGDVARWAAALPAEDLARWTDATTEALQAGGDAGALRLARLVPPAFRLVAHLQACERLRRTPSYVWRLAALTRACPDRAQALAQQHPEWRFVVSEILESAAL